MNEIWCAYAEGKQAWKEAGNYYTPEELKQMDVDIQKDFEDGTFRFDTHKEEVFIA